MSSQAPKLKRVYWVVVIPDSTAYIFGTKRQAEILWSHYHKAKLFRVRREGAIETIKFTRRL